MAVSQRCHFRSTAAALDAHDRLDQKAATMAGAGQ